MIPSPAVSVEARAVMMETWAQPPDDGTAGAGEGERGQDEGAGSAGDGEGGEAPQDGARVHDHSTSDGGDPGQAAVAGPGPSGRAPYSE